MLYTLHVRTEDGEGREERGSKGLRRDGTWQGTHLGGCPTLGETELKLVSERGVEWVVVASASPQDTTQQRLLCTYTDKDKGNHYQVT